MPASKFHVVFKEIIKEHRDIKTYLGAQLTDRHVEQNRHLLSHYFAQTAVNAEMLVKDLRTL